jgi:hypothetical protein
VTCQTVLWFEALYLAGIGLVSWWIATRPVSNLALLVSAVAWIAVGFVLFWAVELIAVWVATGGYARELGWCPSGANIPRLGHYSLIWIPVFAVACAWLRVRGRNNLSGEGAQE